MRFSPSRRAIMLARVRVRVSRALGTLTLIVWAKGVRVFGATGVGLGSGITFNFFIIK